MKTTTPLNGIIRFFAVSLFFTIANTSQAQQLVPFKDENKKWGFADETGKVVITPKYDDAAPFSEGLAAVGIGGISNEKFGFIDGTGKVIIPLKYEEAGSFSEGLAAIKMNYKFGYINMNGDEVVPPKYVRAQPFSEGLASVYLRDINKWGLIDKTGKEIVFTDYKNMNKFSEGLAAVNLNDKWGFIDKTAKLVIPCIYSNKLFLEEVYLSFSEGLCPVSKGEWGVIDKTGRMVAPFKYYEIGAFHNGMAAFMKFGKWGFLDNKGNEAIPAIYNDLNKYTRHFSNGTAMVQTSLNNFGDIGIIDKTGREIIPCKYNLIKGYSENEISCFPYKVLAAKLKQKWGAIDTVGKELIPFKYDDMELVRSSATAYIKAKRNGKWEFFDLSGKPLRTNVPVELTLFESKGKMGIMNSNGKVIVQAMYNTIRPFKEGLAAVNTDLVWGFIDETGKVVIPVEYDKVTDFSEGYSKVEKGVVNYDGSVPAVIGYIDKTGKLVYHQFEKLSEGLRAVSFKSKGGYINSEGKEIIPMIYGEVNNFNEGFAKVRKDGLYGIINKEGKEMVPTKYDELYIGSDVQNSVTFKLKDKWGYIDAQGNDVVYSSATYISNSVLVARTENGKIIFINKKGQQVFSGEFSGYRGDFGKFQLARSEKGWHIMDADKHYLDTSPYDLLINNGSDYGEMLLSKAGSVSYGGYWNQIDATSNKMIYGPPVVPPSANELYYFIMPNGLVLFLDKTTGLSGIKLADGKILVQPRFIDIYPNAGVYSNEKYDNPKIGFDKSFFSFKTANNFRFSATVNPVTLVLKGISYCEYCITGYIYGNQQKVITSGETTTYSTAPVQKLKSEKFDVATGNWIKTYSYESTNVTRKAADKVDYVTQKRLCSHCNGKYEREVTFKWNGNDYEGVIK